MKTLQIVGTLLCASFVPLSYAHESELFGVTLGAGYVATKTQLAEKYGAPIQSVDEGDVKYDAFRAVAESGTILIIASDPRHAKYVSSIQLSGDKKIAGFNFLGALNLGNPEEGILFGFPKPRSVKPVVDGFIHYAFNGTNVSVEAKNGKIASIQIAIDGGISLESSTGVLYGLSDHQGKILQRRTEMQKKLTPQLAPEFLEAQLKSLTVDRLKSRCNYRHPMRLEKNGSLVVDARVAGTVGPAQPKNLFANGSFLLDTGFAESSITPAFCKKMGCKTSKSAKSPKLRGTGGLLFLGPMGTRLPDFAIEQNGILASGGLDGVIGRDVILSKDVFIDFVRESLCFPNAGEIESVAKELGYVTVAATTFDDAIQVPVQLNGERVTDLFLDTGSDITSLMPATIAKLKLPALGKQREADTFYGKYTAKLFGPVQFEWAGAPKGYEMKLNEVSDARTQTFAKIGNDVMGSLVIGLNRKKNVVYLGQ